MQTVYIIDILCCGAVFLIGPLTVQQDDSPVTEIYLIAANNVLYFTVIESCVSITESSSAYTAAQIGHSGCVSVCIDNP